VFSHNVRFFTENTIESGYSFYMSCSWRR